MKSRPPVVLVSAILLGMRVSFASTINIPADYPSIQQGIDSSSPGDTILVQPGRYLENLNYNGKNVTVASLYLVTLDTAYISSTVIDGSGYTPSQMLGSCVSFYMGETPQAQLIGFTITNGSGNRWFVGAFPGRYGGGIFIQNASPTLHHLRLMHNKGGINGSIILPGAGGGISLDNSNAILHDLEFIDNSACTPEWDDPNAGGALYIFNCPGLAVTNAKMMRDTCCSYGGGVCITASTVDLIDCLIVGNYSHNIGGGIQVNTNSTVRVINCTIVDNHSDYFAGGGIYAADNTTLQMVNSILWKNTPYEVALDNRFSPTTTSITHSDMQGGTDSIYRIGSGSFNWLSGNINVDPMFTNDVVGDFTLAVNSPCISAGTTDTTGLHLPVYDLTGRTRIVDTLDMGAYEYQFSATVNEFAGVPDGFRLEQAYPNPFNPATTIGFALGAMATVTIDVFDILGRPVRTLVNGEYPPGRHAVQFFAGDLSTGAYFYRMTAVTNSHSVFQQTKRLAILK